MKYNIAAVIVALSIATPALSLGCFDAEQALEDMVSNGFHITFGDSSADPPVFMAEDGKGNWVIFALQGEAICPFAGGGSGVRYHMPPNA